VRENERWLPSFPLKSGKFTDLGFRFRLNIFNMLDSWVPGFPNTIVKFFDLKIFNHDIIETDLNNKFIATMYYRIDIDQVLHNRNVFVFMDWLGAIAGIEKFLLKWLTFIFGGFIQYNAAIEIINQHYKKREKDDCQDKESNSVDGGHKKQCEEHCHDMHISMWQRMKCYFSNKYAVYKMCCGNHKTLKTIQEVKEMNARLKKDFNTKNILDLLEQVSK